MPHPTDADPRLATIRGLLAKAEATTFPAEAEVFTAKATELMQRYAIDEALVWAADGEGDTPVETILAVHRPFVAQKSLLVATVADAYGCHALRLGSTDTDGAEQMAIVGFRSDVSLVETLVTSLFVQLTTAVTAPGAAPAGTATQVAGWRRSFIVGFTTTIGTRLAASRAAAAAAAEAASAGGPAATSAAPDAAGNTADPPTSSVELVLLDRADAVEDDFRRRYPRIRTSRVSVGTSVAGHRAGTAAGRSADLGGRRLGGRRAIGSSRRP